MRGVFGLVLILGGVALAVAIATGNVDPTKWGAYLASLRPRAGSGTVPESTAVASGISHTAGQAGGTP